MTLEDYAAELPHAGLRVVMEYDGETPKGVSLVLYEKGKPTQTRFPMTIETDDRPHAPGDWWAVYRVACAMAFWVNLGYAPGDLMQLLVCLPPGLRSVPPVPLELKDTTTNALTELEAVWRAPDGLFLRADLTVDEVPNPAHVPVANVLTKEELERFYSMELSGADEEGELD